MFAQVDINLMEHTKSKRLCKKLKINPRESVGLVVCLWLYALKENPDGVMIDRTDEDIADAIHWDGDPADLLEALISSGFIERTEDGWVSVYDWHEHTGSAFTLRAKNRERQRRHRDKKKSGVMSRTEQEREEEQEQEPEKKKKIKKKAVKKKAQSLDQILEIKKQLWANTFGSVLDGVGGRPSLEDVIATAWDHKARKKYTDAGRYLENWIRKEFAYWEPKKNGYRKPEQKNNAGEFGPWLAEGYNTKQEWEAAKCRN